MHHLILRTIFVVILILYSVNTGLSDKPGKCRFGFFDISNVTYESTVVTWNFTDDESTKPVILHWHSENPSVHSIESYRTVSMLQTYEITGLMPAWGFNVELRDMDPDYTCIIERSWTTPDVQGECSFNFFEIRNLTSTSAVAMWNFTDNEPPKPVILRWFSSNYSDEIIPSLLISNTTVHEVNNLKSGQSYRFEIREKESNYSCKLQRFVRLPTEGKCRFTSFDVQVSPKKYPVAKWNFADEEREKTVYLRFKREKIKISNSTAYELNMIKPLTYYSFDLSDSDQNKGCLLERETYVPQTGTCRITFFRTEDITSRTVSFTWNFVDETPKPVILRWKHWFSEKFHQVTLADILSYQHNELESSETYYFQIKEVDSTYSCVMEREIRTLPKSRCEIRSFNVTEVQPTSALASWNFIDDGSPNDFELIVSGQNRKNKIYTRNTSYEINDLYPGRRYSLRLNDGYYCFKERIIYTPTLDPQEVTVSVINVSMTSASLHISQKCMKGNWNHTRQTKFHVKIKRTRFASQSISTKTILFDTTNGINATFSINYLQPYARYACCYDSCIWFNEGNKKEGICTEPRCLEIRTEWNLWKNQFP